MPPEGLQAAAECSSENGARGLILLLDIDCWPISAAEIGIASGQCQFGKGFRLTLQKQLSREWSPWLILLLTDCWPIFCCQR
jgi:hypothetical protein